MVAIVAACAAATPTAVLIEHSMCEVEVLSTVVPHVIATGVPLIFILVPAVASFFLGTGSFVFRFPIFGPTRIDIAFATIATLGQQTDVGYYPFRRLLQLQLLL